MLPGGISRAGADHAASNRIRILLVDEQRAFTESFSRCVETTPDLAVAGASSPGEEALYLLRTQKPQVVLVDPHGSYAGLHQLLRASEVRLKESVIGVLTDGLSDRMLDHFVQLQISCLSKRQPVNPLLEAIRRMATGECCYSADIRSRLECVDGVESTEVRQRGRLGRLSARQLEVLQHLAYGKRVRDVAQALHLSEKAVESHKYRIMSQLGIHDRVELCLYAVREGLITPWPRTPEATPALRGPHLAELRTGAVPTP